MEGDGVSVYIELISSYNSLVLPVGSSGMTGVAECVP